MSNWRDVIIKKFKKQNSPFIFVYDEDFLLSEEIILNNITKLGYEIIRYDDSISFRYVYEQKYRAKEQIYKFLVLANDDIFLPYEFEKKALNIRMDIQTIFPKFSAKVVRNMYREDFDDLYRLHATYQGSSVEQETLDFIIKKLYKIPYEMIDSEVGLYKILLSMHYKKRELPERMKQFLYEVWRQVIAFQNIPLKKMITSSTFFYQYLEGKWATFVKEISSFHKEQVNDSVAIEYSNPLANRDVRRLMNNLFLEGTLKRVREVDTSNLPAWMQPGIEERDPQEEMAKKIDYFYKEINTNLPKANRYKDWINMMEWLAELKQSAIMVDKNVDEIVKEVNRSFESWMVDHYHSLTSLPPFPKPKLVHHIPHVINKEKHQDEKVALLVIDGMSYIQWVIIRKHLKNKGFSFEENGVLAWVPTLTSVSRQAIFSGNTPYTFGRTITTTASEEKWWKAFWEDHGIVKQYVTYQKGLGKETYDNTNIKGLSRKSTKVYGAVVDVIDQFSHHAVLGEKSVLSNLQLWLESNYLEKLLTDLKDRGFTVYLTSDHGNTKATGIGRVSEGVLVDQKGERVRIYNDQTIYKDSAAKLSGIKWTNIGLPEDYYVLFSPYGQAFVPKKQDVVTHGGISIEEVVVPFVKVAD